MDLSITHDFCEFIIEEETHDDLSLQKLLLFSISCTNPRYRIKFINKIGINKGSLLSCMNEDEMSIENEKFDQKRKQEDVVIEGVKAGATKTENVIRSLMKIY